MAQRYEYQMRLFEPEYELPVLTQVPFRPKSGFQYIYKWETSSKRKDWRADGYRWRQNATVKFNHGSIKCKRYYFKLKVGPGNDFTMDFSKHAIECPLYEKRMLIWYQGDDSVVVDFSHGISKNPNINRTLPIETTSNGETRTDEDSEMADVAQSNTNLETSVASKSTEVVPVANAPKSGDEDRLFLEAIYNLVELRSDTGFVSDIHLAPGLLVTCFQESTVMEFKEFLFREDLSTQCLYYDTSFEAGNLGMGILSFRQTEFEEAPLIPLMIMIHEKDLDSAHNFFFSRLTEMVHELKATEKVVIITGEEDAVIKALDKHLPEPRRFRCWSRALREIKEQLKLLGITDENTVERYENDFYSLLDQETSSEYKALLAEMYLKKWNKEFSKYFDQIVDPEMDRMSTWALHPLEIPLSSSSELLLSILKRFNGWQSVSIDNVVVCLMRVTEYLNDTITRGRIRLGDYTVKENLSVTYCQGDAIIADVVTIDQLVKSIEVEIKSRKKGRKRHNKTQGAKLTVGTQESSDCVAEDEQQRQLSEAVDSLASVVQELLEDEM